MSDRARGRTRGRSPGEAQPSGPPVSAPELVPHDPAERASLRARVVKRLFLASLRIVRSLGAGGTPDFEGPEEQLREYLLGMREATEWLVERVPVSRRLLQDGPRDAPVRTLVLADDRAVVTHGDGRPSAAGVLQGRHGTPDLVAAADRVVLHLHGGAYCLGSPETHRGFGAALSRTALATVILPEYRLAPEAPYPAALDDVASTYRWLLEERDVDPGRLVVTGDSAGGGLAAALLVRLRDRGEPLPAGMVAISPWMDLAGTGRSLTALDGTDPWLSKAMTVPAARGYAGEAELTDPEVSPLYADLTGLPPMLLHVGGDEILLDDAARFVAAARRQGVDASLGRFPGLWHVFQLVPGTPEARDSLREIGAFVRRVTGSPSRSAVAGPAAA